MRRIRTIGEDEMSLWAEALDDVAPMPGRSRPVAKPKKIEDHPPPRPRPSAPERPRPSVPKVGRFDERDRRRLGRSGQSFEARFDLHGYGHDAGRTALKAFLGRCRDHGMSVVLVVTGKSEREARTTSFRREVPMWLALPDFAHLVSAFDKAHPRHGGEGALYVRLRRRR